MPSPSPSLSPSLSLFPGGEGAAYPDLDASGRDVALGRLALLTTSGDVEESTGDGVEATGPVVLGSDRSGRTLKLGFPVHGNISRDTDPFAAGARARRQARALLDNEAARLEGLYLRIVFDPEQNGWVVCGGGQLTYADGGPTINDYTLELTDAYRYVRRLHLPARRLLAQDLRSGFAPRDVLGQVFSTDFAATDAQPVHALPAGARRVTLDGLPATTVPSAHPAGAMPLVAAAEDSTIIAYELDENLEDASDVVLVSRGGTLATEQTADWEEIYGPNQPLVDVPLIHNGQTRARWMPDEAAVAVDGVDGSGNWVERGRVTVWASGIRRLAAGDAPTPRVVWWTPERGVLLVQFTTDDDELVDCYVTLQRGWLGPRLEVYANAPGGPLTPRLLFSHLRVDEIELATAGGTAVWSTGADTTAVTLDEPWAYTQPTFEPAQHVAIAVVQEGVTVKAGSDAGAYGATHPTVKMIAPAAAGYLSARLALATPVDDAHPITRSGLDGPQDLGGQGLVDCRAEPLILAR